MITLLHLSDIHFKKIPSEVDEYSQMRSRMYEVLEEICKSEKITGILICGDIAFSGNKQEYDEKAKPFLNKLQEITGCKDAQIYMVPGNHDRAWGREFGNTRNLMRNGFLHCNESENLFVGICLEEPKTLKLLLKPSENYIEFASKYACVSEGVRKVFSDQKLTSNDKLYWISELFEEGGYKINIVGINTTLLSDKEDKKHKQFLPPQLYKIDKEQKVINISMMHHPIDELKGSVAVASNFDKRFLVQLTGHIHVPSSSPGSVLKISSGAFMPPLNERKEAEDGYNPVFNVITLGIEDDNLNVLVQPYKWEWSKENDDDGVFEKQETESFSLKAKDIKAAVSAKGKELKLPEGLSERDVEIKWINDPYKESIIKRMYPDFDVKHNFLLDSAEFFSLVRTDDRYDELYNLLK